ncbi:MAG: DUF4340 domain-containing protein [Bacteroidota bacterium]|nr:DUF4340 domain-containing protein [Bacteroidota bacterium]
MKKTTVYLITLFVILFAITYFVILPTENRTASYSLDNSIFSIDSAKTNKISIRKLQSNITFEKIEPEWNLTEPINYKADQEAVYSLLAGASKLKISSLISSNPEKQTLFQVDTITGIELKFQDFKGNGVALIVGKMGPSYLDSYIRAINSNDVYLAEGLNSWMINKEINDWRDKTIFQTDKNSITKVQYEFEKENFVLEKTDNNWMTGSDSIETSKIDQLLSTLSDFRAEDFVDNELTLQHPQLKIEITTNDKSSLVFYPMPPDSSRYWIVSSSSQQIYVVSKYSANQIIKTKKEFLK